MKEQQKYESERKRAPAAQQGEKARSLKQQRKKGSRKRRNDLFGPTTFAVHSLTLLAPLPWDLVPLSSVNFSLGVLPGKQVPKGEAAALIRT